MRRAERALLAELAFAGNPVVVLVHLGSGAVAQEEGGLFAGVHLRAMGAAIALILWLAWCNAVPHIDVPSAWLG